jgi:hypothetical protein
VHVATELFGALQGVHEVPQVAADVSSTHVPPQSWKPAPHLDEPSVPTTPPSEGETPPSFP